MYPVLVYPVLRSLEESTWKEGPRLAKNIGGTHLQHTADNCRAPSCIRCAWQSFPLMFLCVPKCPLFRSSQGFYEKVIWRPMAVRIGLLRTSALQNDGRIKPVILQCRTPQETNPKGHWGPTYFLRNSPLNGDVDLLAASCLL